MLNLSTKTRAQTFVCTLLFLFFVFKAHGQNSPTTPWEYKAAENMYFVMSPVSDKTSVDKWKEFSQQSYTALRTHTKKMTAETETLASKFPCSWERDHLSEEEKEKMEEEEEKLEKRQGKIDATFSDLNNARNIFADHIALQAQGTECWAAYLTDLPRQDYADIPPFEHVEMVISVTTRPESQAVKHMGIFRNPGYTGVRHPNVSLRLHGVSAAYMSQFRPEKTHLFSYPIPSMYKIFKKCSLTEKPVAIKMLINFSPEDPLWNSIEPSMGEELLKIVALKKEGGSYLNGPPIKYWYFNGLMGAEAFLLIPLCNGKKLLGEI